MQRVIGIVSGKGGVGKTTTAINLGLALSEIGEQVTVVDGDLNTANLGIQLGLYHFPLTIHDFLKKKADKSLELMNATYMHNSGLRVLPASISLSNINSDAKQLRKIFEKLEGTVIVDTPPGLDTHSLNILDACDDVLLISTPELHSLTDAVKASNVAKEMDKNVIGTLITRYGESRYDLRKEDIQNILDVPLLGLIPEDPEIKKSVFKKSPVVFENPFSKSSIAYKKVAAKMLNRDYKAPKYVFLKRFLNSFGR